MFSRKVNRTEFANLLLEWKPSQKVSRDLFLSQPESPPIEWGSLVVLARWRWGNRRVAPVGGPC